MAFPSKSNTPSFKSSSSSAFASSSTSAFLSPHIHYFRQSTTTRRNAAASPPPPSSHSLRFGLDRSISPSRSISTLSRDHIAKNDGKSQRQTSNVKRTCMCSPTTHPGSFRCSFHKNNPAVNNHPSSRHHRLNARRSAMTNSLVRIGTVEGDLVKRALIALIRPSSHHQRRCTTFRSRPSRLSAMSRA